jgi:glycosyltransferase involved in cell wall biosynthesis
MSVHNEGARLLPTLKSVEEQTFTDIEMIVIDDGSRDDTWQILSLVDRPHFRIHRQANRGQTAALNLALSMARGRYIARHDAQDVSLPERFARQVAYLEANPKTALVGAQVDWIDGAGRLIRHFDYPTGSTEIKSRLKEKNAFGHGSVMIRRAALDEAGIYREAFRLAQDYDLWLRLAEKFEIANLPETLYQMRFSARMASVARNGEQAAYAGLARRLAAERAENGQEQTDVTAAGGEIVARYARMGYLARRAERGRNLVTWAERLLWWGEPASHYAWPVWTYGLLAWPFSIRLWKFAARQLRQAISGAKSTQSELPPS